MKTPANAFWLCLILVAAVPRTAIAQLPWQHERWRIEARESAVERYEGREALMLDGGLAWLDEVDFRDGVIEFDLAATDALGFYGVVFRAVDNHNYEHFYLRPFQSGRSDATQYSPVYNGVSGWQIYAGDRHALAVPIATDRWVHVRMVVRERRLEVSVDGRTLVFPKLERTTTAGAVALTSSGAPARFANVVVMPTAEPEIGGETGAPPPEPPAGLIEEWRVSSAFAESRIDPTAELDPDDRSGLRWTAAEPDFRGIVNLDRKSVV